FAHNFTRELVLPQPASLASDLGLFVLAHSLFFTGGVFFRRSPFVKTLFGALGYGATLMIASIVFALSTGTEEMPFDLSWLASIQGVPEGYEISRQIGRVAWFVLFPFLLYGAAYHRAAENEVR